MFSSSESLTDRLERRLVEFAFICMNHPVEIIYKESQRVGRGQLYSIDPKTMSFALKKYQVGDERWEMKIVRLCDIQSLGCVVPDSQSNNE